MTASNDISRPIPFEQIAHYPLPGAATPVQVAFSPGDLVLTWLHSPERTLNRRLFARSVERLDAEAVEVPVHAASVSEEDLPLEERLRRERTREVGVGITSVLWAERADVLLVPTADTLYVIDGLEAAVAAGDPPPAARAAVRSPRLPFVDPRLSPDGSLVTFVLGGDLYVARTGGEAASEDEFVRLTSSATEGITNGLAEFVAQEEMDRAHGTWWSPDSAWIVYTEVDERHIPIYRIVHQGSDAVGPAAQEDHRYPFAGAANAIVRLGVVPAAGGETVWMETGDPDQYLARVDWMPDGGLMAQLESRDQAQLDVVSFDPATRARSYLHSEVHSVWINLHDDFRPLVYGQEAGSWTWSSERSGHRHLELRSASGALVRVLTSGDWDVDRLEGIDEECATAWFTGTLHGATERHLYGVRLAGGDVERVTSQPGYHDVVLDHGGGLFVDRHSSLDGPPTLTLRSLRDGQPLATIFDDRDPRIDELALEAPELTTLLADDGTELNALVYRPAGSGPFPTVVSVYGGPHVQRVVNGWGPTVDMRAQALRRRGYLVLVVDNRGSARRGLEFEAPLRHRMGSIEVEDQVAGVRWAVEQGITQADRVGIYGWSYGGYMTLMCLAKAADVFRAGVAGAPVTHYDGYDTHYTERYMGTPADNPEGYESSSVMAHVDGLTGDLLLVHGLIDENVHFRHTARLINALVRAGRSYELLLFPDERHLPRREEDRAFMEREVSRFLERALGEPHGTSTDA